MGELTGVLGASVGLVLGGEEPDGMGAVELQGVASWLVRGAVALVQLLLVVPDHPNLYPIVGAQVAEAVLDCALTPDPVPVWLLRKGCWTFAPFLHSGYASVWGVAGCGREDGEDAWSGFAGRVGGMRGVGRLLPCRLFWLGWGRVRLFSVSIAWVGLEVVALGGREVGRGGA